MIEKKLIQVCMLTCTDLFLASTRALRFQFMVFSNVTTCFAHQVQQQNKTTLFRCYRPELAQASIPFGGNQNYKQLSMSRARLGVPALFECLA